MKVTYYGHSAFLVELDGARLLFDPFITGHGQAPDVDIHAIKPDTILITHGHGDHVGDTIDIAKSSGAAVITNYEIATWLNARGVDNTVGLNLGGHADLGGGAARVQLVPAWHSSVLPDGSNGGAPGGFVVAHKKGAFYYSGDTALFAEMKLFGRRTKIDTAFLCLGDHFTMDMVDAAHAAEFVGADTVVGMHFDTFPPIQIDHDRARDVFAAAKKKLILPRVGDRFTV